MNSYSQYIDYEFSNSNNVSHLNLGSKTMNIDRFNNTMCDGNIMLEPRLQEYIKKKKHYKMNNIKPLIPIEREFSITDYDKKVIRDFLKGKKDMYKTKNLEINNTKSNKQNYFPSKQFRDNDKRQDKLKRNEIFEKPENMGMFATDENNSSFYENQFVNYDENEILDARDFDESRFDPRVDSRIRSGKLDYNPDKSKYKVSGQVGNRLYNNNGVINGNEIAFNQVLDRNNLAAANNPYRSRAANPVHFSQQSKNSLDNEKVYGVKNFTNNYEQGKNISRIETELMHGIPAGGRKSYGYRNPEEHYYNYIDPEFQNDINTTSLAYHGFGQPTRLENKKRSCEIYEREIY